MLILQATSRGDLKEDMIQAIQLADKLDCTIDIVIGCKFHIEIQPKADIEIEWLNYLKRNTPWKYNK